MLHGGEIGSAVSTDGDRESGDALERRELGIAHLAKGTQPQDSAALVGACL